MSEEIKDFPAIHSVSHDAETGGLLMDTADGRYRVSRELVGILAASAIEFPAPKDEENENEN